MRLLAARPSALSVLFGVCVVGGIALRVGVLASPLGGLDSDEAVWGLMARHAALHGDLSTFFWGQNYGGSQEVLLTTPLFWLFGSGIVVLRLVPLTLFAVAALLVWRVGRRTVGEPAAGLAGVLFWIWPSYLIWKSTRAHGFYGASLVLALALVLLVLRLRERQSALDLALLGLVTGLGWWASPQFAIVALPALGWLAVRRRELLRRAWIWLAAALVAGAPWLVWNVSHGWRSMTTPFERGDDTYFDHLRTFFAATLPQALGLRVPFSLGWITGPVLGRALEALALAGIAYLAVRRPCRRELVVVVAISYPFLQSFSPFSFLNDEPRYLVLFIPVLALVVAELLASSLLLTGVGLAVAAAVSVVGLLEMNEHRYPVPPVGRERTPADLDPVLRVLDRAEAKRVRAHYAIAYRIDFESDERIVADSTSQIRYQPYHRLVQRTPHPAYVYVADSPAEQAVGPMLASDGYRRVRAGDWAVYLSPRRR